MRQSTVFFALEMWVRTLTPCLSAVLPARTADTSARNSKRSLLYIYFSESSIFILVVAERFLSLHTLSDRDAQLVYEVHSLVQRVQRFSPLTPSGKRRIRRSLYVNCIRFTILAHTEGRNTLRRENNLVCWDLWRQAHSKAISLDLDEIYIPRVTNITAKPSTTYHSTRIHKILL